MRHAARYFSAFAAVVLLSTACTSEDAETPGSIGMSSPAVFVSPAPAALKIRAASSSPTVTRMPLTAGSTRESRPETSVFDSVGVTQIMELQARLTELGYRPGVVDGTYGEATRAAVVAFQKREGLTRDGLVGPETIARLASPRGPGPKDGLPVPRIEIDLTRQIAFVVLADGSVTTIPVSTGSNEIYTDIDGNKARARTPTGEFTIRRRIDGVRLAPLGLLYRPMYFVGGFAIHGSNNVPAHPASHGCVRTHQWDQDWLVERVPNGTPVVIRDD